jgi:uncharacterized protein (TIRG00374 family)
MVISSGMVGPMNGQHIRIAAAAFLSAIGIWWFAHDVQWDEVLDILGTVKLQYVLLAAATLLAEFLLRAHRWSILLRPLGTKVRFMDLWSATVIGAAVNTLVPLRAGEIAKPMVVARRTGHRLSTLFATNVMERVFDLLGMVTILVIMVLMLPGSPGDDALVVNLYRYGSLIGFAALAALAVFFVLATKENAARDVFEQILKIGPTAARRPFLHLFDGFVAGLGSTRDRQSLWKAGVLSIAMWLNGAFAIWLLFQAFGFELPFAAACFTGVAIALTVALPQAPGFIGVFHIAIEKTMVLWGMPDAESKGYALVFWAVSFVPVTMVGMVAMWREGMNMRDVTGHEE